MDKKKKVETIDARRQAALRGAERFANARLRKVFDWKNSPLDIQPARGGKNSLIYFIHPAGSPDRRVVARLFQKVKHWRRHRRALELAAGAKAQTPRVLCHAGSRLTQWRFGYRFLITEAAPGAAIEEQAPSSALRAAVARALASLHANTGPSWGRDERLRAASSYAGDLERGIERRVEELASRPSDLSSRHIEALRLWLGDRLKYFENLREFQLCHHHLGADDILYDPLSDRSTLIDCANIQFSRASRDLSGLSRRRWIASPEEWEEFLEVYFENSSESRREEYAAESEFFRVFMLLSDLRNHVLRASGQGAVSFEGTTAREPFELLLEILGQ